MICFGGCNKERILFLDSRCQGEDNPPLKWDPQQHTCFVGQSILAVHTKGRSGT